MSQPINPNFPNSGLRSGLPTGGVQIPDAVGAGGQRNGYANVVQAGNGSPQTYGPQYQVDPIAQAMSLFDRPVGSISPTGKQSNWSWENADKKPSYNSAGIDEFLGVQASDEQAERAQYGKYAGARVMAALIQDIDMANAKGRYGLMLRAMESFKIDHNLNIAVPAAMMFVEYINEHPPLRKRIGRNAAMAVAGYVAKQIEFSGDIDVANLEQSVVACIYNTMLFEFAGWLANTEVGRNCVPMIKSSRYFMSRYERISELESTFAEYFAVYDKESPYAQTTIEPRVATDSFLDISRFAAEPAKIMTYGEQTTRQMTESERFLNEMMMENAAAATVRAPQSQPMSYGSDYSWGHNPVVDMASKLIGVRVDYENITAATKSEFNLDDVLHRIGDTSWYVVVQEKWDLIKHIWKDGDPHGIKAHGWSDLVPVVRIDLDNGTEYFEDWIKAKGKRMEHILTDPSLLLPDLVQTKTGEIKSRSVDQEPVKDGSEWITPPLPINELKTAGLSIHRTTPIVTESAEEVEVALTNWFESKKTPDITKVFAASLPLRQVRRCIMEDQEGTSNVYSFLKPLIKGNPTKYNNFFKFYESVFMAIGNHALPDNLGTEIDAYLSHQFKRWLVEARGYGASRAESWFVDLPNLGEARGAIEDWLSKNDYATYLVLTSRGPELERLLSRCQFILPEEQAKAYLESKGGDDLIKEVHNRTIVFAHDVVFTRIGNLLAPSVLLNTRTIRAKRSQVPELFDIVGKAYGPSSVNLAGADQIIAFEDNDDTLWNYTGVDFDRRNVATLRRVDRRGSLYMFSF